jgi:hypothetical protein|nr:MAG: hypothetical protein [Bacteriophage sp.]DAE80413.1 MAG TPA: hypothetical protein [Caudoviricetes sp.]UWG11954.1 MAG: hypothetical protein [Bacteriophage sp.]UWG21603.1 MAG: hypothetical protein [Bacteriophage sp.]DAL34279.1 MAG TPA_asm: hypothetical protein [Caudoviricetes sp.]
MGETNTEVKPQVFADVFTKQQLAESKRYKKKRDLLEALLENGKTYTIAQVDKIIGDYLKKEVR